MSDGSGIRPVLIDTNVASYMVVRSGELRAYWSRVLLGQVLVISGQTRAEILALPLNNSWGQKRISQLLEAIADIPVIPMDRAVQEEYARLTAWGLDTGHSIGQKTQVADRWIAATALVHDLPLAAQDSDFDGIPGLVRFTPSTPAGPS